MAGFGLEQWVSYLGLERVDDPNKDHPVYRKRLDGKIIDLKELDLLVAQRLRDLRTDRQIAQAKVATLLGVKEATYSRYENASSLMTVGRLIHVFEVLDITPEEFFDPFVDERPSHSKEKSGEAVRNKLMGETVDHLKKLDDTALKMVHDLVIAMEPRTIGRQ
ncbi:helix-turn-helix domain-containing protein [Agrobacterium tumefaciens]|uniref:helix-turn-helix domain-containing protein n=1 Tax=Agrobacterium tumefaciens TaxID=358 RepID=UPI001573AC66|nr:helix-turn-helix transcriptional regulator [Agrobacterium tumefaciens]NSY51556.1 helix-turn-helix transcriptional regulator [Agrobacterium tumefaciens]NTA45819.1 helix-turn-helix transcriptional regulator [Agrobacterium tumefaciens]NTA80689.1 helix-turn-helix transcriptional regulator [Agrobacterium tumefaciens]UXT85389.1 helix-turn-helix transcriptional regulator [Agrobacterium tumefaciens]WCK16992.1 helix-turn-helix transcriptional regulator [Agrobacterium tumefaciens]